MKFTVPGMMITALLMASPALAQYGTPGTSAPDASVTKDDTTNATKQSKKHTASTSHKKKHMASYKQRSHDKAMKPKAQTTGSGSTSAPGDTTPKSR